MVENRNVTFRMPNGRLYLVKDTTVYYNDGEDLHEGLVVDVVTKDDGTFLASNYEVTKVSVVPEGCCKSFRVAFSCDKQSSVVAIGYDGKAILYSNGEEFCTVNDVLFQLGRYEVSEIVRGSDNESSDLRDIYGALLDFESAGGGACVSLYLDTSVRLVELLKGGLEPDAMFYVVNGLVYRRNGWYLLRGKDGVWKTGCLTSYAPAMERFIDAYSKRRVSFPTWNYSDILRLAKELRVSLSEGDSWVSLPNGMCCCEIEVTGGVKVTLCIAGGKYWSSSCNPDIYKQAWVNYENCLGILVDAG